MNADSGSSTRIGMNGARISDKMIATTVASNASTTACTARPNASERPVMPVALNTAKSRVRSIACR